MTGEQKADIIEQASVEYLRKTMRKQYPMEIRKLMAREIAVKYNLDPNFFIQLIAWNNNYEVARFNT